MIGKQPDSANPSQFINDEPALPPHELVEWRKCKRSPAYFIDTYCQIRDSEAKRWIRFALWREQYEVLVGWNSTQYNIALKARQLGMTWLAISYALHGIVFNSHYEVIMVSKTQRESFDMLDKERLRGMYGRLPAWMKAREVTVDNVTHWRLSNGSGARAFPPNNVDSYSANLLVIDEADYPAVDLSSLLVSAEPVIDAGGKLILISRGYKDNPESYFKKLYRSARKGNDQYRSYFLPWYSRPSRTREWYEKQCATAMEREGTLDSIYEKYPETDEQALAARTLDKRIPPQFLSQCYEDADALDLDELHANAPVLPGLAIYRNPGNGERFVLGADPAEGNPTSDDSALHVLNIDTGEEVARLAGKIQVDTFASYVADMAQFFNNAKVLVERNNHGHAVILWLKDHSSVTLLKGKDNKLGWQTNTTSKAELYSDAISDFRERDAQIHSFSTMTQLQSIDGSTLNAPDGMHDDEAMSFVLALKGRRLNAMNDIPNIMWDYDDGFKRR